MKLTRLRIVGFKSFVEPTEFLVEPGLTGVVGPNGCGKSNLVEALRWAMGESSHKSMRASGMDDVIFSGSGRRPARNTAEVTLTIDNSDRQAPVAFNDADALDISRRIEREEGSTYRINGREVRARDVQLLFADAATGARSPALVRQGQINEIIAAKPQARRRILEDAAGIAGLHARRHEAELRLKAAEDNLLRVEDVVREIEARIDALRRQGRQAVRYRSVSAEIRRLEALLQAIAYAQARDEATVAERQAEADLNLVADRQRDQAEAAKVQAVAAHELPRLRDGSAASAAAVQRLALALGELDAQERRARERVTELERHLAEIGADTAREAAQRGEADAALARLEAEAAELDAAEDGSDAVAAEGTARLEGAEAELGRAETCLGALQGEAAALTARRSELARMVAGETERAARFASERVRVERDLQALSAAGAGHLSIDGLRTDLSCADWAARAAEERSTQARLAVTATREAEARSRAPLAQAERKAQRLETEARTLAKLFAPATADLWPRALDQVTVARGYEAALGTALGDDLDASTNASAPAHWAETDGDDDPPLPAGVQPLSELTRGPAVLQRRLRQIGLVDRTQGARFRALLRPGQRLVSREGDLWRWDGFTTAAEAPTAAARRLAEKNRLGDLQHEAAEARGLADELRAEADRTQAEAREAGQAEAQALDAVRQTRRALDSARERLAAAERREAEAESRRSALQEAVSRLGVSEADARARAEEAEAALTELAPAPELEAALLEARTEVAELRAAASEARAAQHALLREAEQRRRRRDAVATEITLWSDRARRAAEGAANLAARRARVEAEHQALIEAPETNLVQRRTLLASLEAAEGARKEASDRLTVAETAQAAADRAARAALEALATAREARAGSQARFEALVQRVAEITRGIAEGLETTPAGLLELAGLGPGAPLPDSAEPETKLARLKDDRERMGAVNLRAEEELGDIEAKREALVSERDDLAEAIKRLRQAISNLNREGRERLLAAFEVVNQHFQRLFMSLFDGGTAELTLVDSDDPLEAGLEILARPPGKKPQTMTLLSGGEQALTATALIFAVFLTNPSPICVLDEVDAPLDDANVERYCDLLDEMARQTQTRFVVITHNPITMARMDRLFGVTMAEQGVSQLVSVDLASAERFLEAV